jgi:hypothetical protein
MAGASSRSLVPRSVQTTKLSIGEQHGRVAGDCETEPLSKAVGDEVEIARPRARTFGLSALNVMLEGTPRVTRLGEPKPNQELRRLEEDRHLISIVLVTLV